MKYNLKKKNKKKKVRKKRKNIQEECVQKFVFYYMYIY